jgi:two-component system sensor histidine kinase YesM
MKRLRSVILQRIAVVAAASFLLSAAFTWYYYRTILVGQMLHEDETRLSQTMRQLEYMSDDIAKFAYYLIISDQVQTFYKTFNRLGTYDQFAILKRTLDDLVGNKGLRKEVDSFALVLPDGRAFWSESRFDSYFQERLKENWYQSYKRSGQENAFSEPHTLLISGNGTQTGTMISFIVSVKDIEQPDRKIGELIVNLDYENFKSLLDFGSRDFEGFVWLHEGGAVLYEKKPAAPGMPSESALVRALEAGKENGAVPVRGGYLLVERSNGNQWALAAFISQKKLMGRGQFVLWLLGVFSATSTIITLLLMMPTILRMTRPIMRLYNAMSVVSSGNLQTSVDIRTGDELEKLGQGFNRMTLQLRAHLEESIRFEQKKRDMELELLLSQLNPHFVYNTLNAVLYLAEKQGSRDIVRMVGAFIRLLQDAGKIGQARLLIPLREELRLLQDYIEIQSYRYAGMFEVVRDVDEDAYGCLVPRHLIQPLVENAIFHGICPKDAFGTIRLSASVRDKKLIIRVEDDGVGIEPERLAAIWDDPAGRRPNAGLRHIGLANTKQRLEHLFDGQAALSIDSRPGAGTAVTIELPKAAE